MRVEERAFAKLNLTLEVGGKRQDGYHDICSVMTCCDLHDTLTLKESKSTFMTCDDPSLSVGADNLCVRAAKVFFEDMGIDGGAEIHLQKVIPMQAGLGGGSADAAAVLRALRKLYAPDAEYAVLVRMAEKIGSDVPFCVLGKTALCRGRGEVMTLLPKLPKLWYVILKPQEAYSTGAMYAALDVCSTERARTTERLLAAIHNQDIKGIYSSVCNDFHLALPKDSTIPEICRKLCELGAKTAMMSGSGSAVFGIYDNPDKAKAAAMLLHKQGERVFFAQNV